MRILIVIPHYFGFGPRCYGSTDATQKQKRTVSLRTCIATLYQQFAGKQQLLHDAGVTREVNQKMKHELDVVVCVRGSDHLLEELNLPQDCFRVHSTSIEDPILLGYACYDVFKESVGKYDWYCFLEDDIVINDPLFFCKLNAFYDAVGSARYLLQPNRFELSAWPELSKTYVDGPLWLDNEEFMAKQRFPGCLDEVVIPFGNFNFRATPAENTHSGCFFLTEIHLRHMLEQPWYGEKVIGYAGRLESAANMYIFTLFNVFKPASECSSFLEVYHHHQKFIQADVASLLHKKETQVVSFDKLANGNDRWSDDLLKPGRQSIHESWFRTDTIDYWRHERMYEAVFRCLAHTRHARWLTVGDGRYGLDAIRMGQHGFSDVTASDIDDSLLKHSQEAGLLQKLYAENAEHFSFGDKSFDYVLCKEAYHHFSRPMLALYEMIRVAQKAVVLIEPQDGYIDLPIGYGKHLVKYEDEGNYVYTLSVRELEKVVLGLGLPAVAYKNFCDLQIVGAETEAASISNPVFAELVDHIAKLEASCKRLENKYSMLMAVIFIEAPDEKCTQLFQENEWVLEQFQG